MPKQKPPRKAGSKAKSRRHGYRGYGSPLSPGSEKFGGTVHWGRGFSGVGFPGEEGAILPPTPEKKEKKDSDS